MRRTHKYLVVVLLMCFFISGRGQQPQKFDAADIQLGLKKLNKLGSVLYIAAHPDDENTRLIAYLSNEALLNTAYLSITRGDGGQNLVGSEIREMLGVIRTQELLMARKMDGGQQFFTRANDFGYSKDAQETFAIWDEEKVLSDVVWVIRKFRPDVIITRFPPDERARHGQHTASAILAQEAFDAAADPSKFPDQLAYVDTWQARSLLFNTHWWFYENKEDFDPSDMLTLDVGAYNHLLGKSYTEIAAESRSMHKSQGFGSTGTRGSELEYLAYVKGERTPKDFFEGKDLTWSRIKNGKAVGDLLSKAYREYNPEMPDQIVPLLLEAYQHMLKLEEGYYQQLKMAEVKKMIRAALGLYLEAGVSETYGIPGETVKVKLEATNRSQYPLILGPFESQGIEKEEQGITLAPNQKYEKEMDLTIPVVQTYSQPYWLRTQGSIGMFDVDDPLLIGQAENEPSLKIPFHITVAGHSLVYEVPVVHKRNDPVKGEIFQPFAIAPPVSLNFEEKVQVFADATPREVSIMVKSGKDSLNGDLHLEIPPGWKITPETVSFDLPQKGSEKMIKFTLYPPELPGEGKIKAIAKIAGQVYSMEKVTISYDHIPDQMLLPEAAAKAVKLEIVTRGHNIGYVMGAGDEIPGSLRQIGYQVELLPPDRISTESLEKYDAIILGIRALNTVERLQYDMPKLLDYAKSGGTLIVQYNTNFRLVTDDYAPYPLELSRDRVAVEGAEVRFLLPDHPVLNVPNKITEADFDFWVQERGLYFPDKWDSRYQAILSTNDPGETPKNGGLLITQYGKGFYIYSGLSWFRELPAGVPGAFRLFANMISLGQQEPGN